MQLTEKHIRRIAMEISIHEHVEEVINWYNDGNLVWSDVEGIGYGWLWAAYEHRPEDWKKLIGRRSIEFLNNLLHGENENTIQFKRKKDSKTWIITSKYNKKIEQEVHITVSNKELFF